MSTAPVEPAGACLPLSLPQQEVWLGQTLERGCPRYNIGGYLEIDAPLDAQMFTAAAARVIARHEALRIRLVADGAMARQVFMAADQAGPEPAELLVERPSRAAALAWMREEMARPFDLYEAPLHRLALVRTPDRHSFCLLKFHHLIADGWAISLIAQDLAVAYNTLAGTLRPWVGGGSYRHVIAADAAFRASDRFARARDHWLAQFPDIPEAPLSRRCTGDATPRRPTSRTLAIDLPWADVRRLEALAAAGGGSLFHVFLALLYVYFARVSGVRELVVGLPLRNRATAEQRRVVGLFAGIMPVRLRLDLDRSWPDLVTTIAAHLRRDYRHQCFPLGAIYQALGLSRQHGLFALVVSYERHDYDLDFAGSPAVARALSHGANPNPLEVYIRRYHDGADVRVDLEHNPAFLDDRDAALLARRLRSLIAQALAAPHQPARALAIRPRTLAAAPARTVAPANPWEPLPPDAQDLAECFARQARRFPQHPAVIVGDRAWTYQELDRRANGIARALLAHPSAARVVLLFGHGAAAITAILGTLKAGKTYVPLPPNVPTPRLRRIIDDARPGIALTDARHRALMHALAGERLPVVEIDALPASDAPPPPARDGDRPAYLLYTSGSTGEPKAVVQTQRNVLHYIRTYSNRLHLSHDDRLTQIAPYNYDAAVIDIFGALLNGATLYPIDLRLNDLGALGERLRGERITVYHSTPTVYRYWTRSLDPAERFASVRLIVLGGEAVVAEDLTPYRRHFAPDCLFVNGLGATEASFALLGVLDRDSVVAAGRVPVGLPLAETRIALLDDAGEDTGVYGEIAVASPYVCPGYWGRPDRDRATFWELGDGNRVWRSGDLGRLLADGTLEVLGRTDSQVKVRGFRVELREIELELMRHPALAQATVVRHDPQPGGAAGDDPPLVAYVVPRDGAAEPGAEALQEQLRRDLPDYMVPPYVIALESLPLTANGKIDRRVLAACPLPGRRAHVRTPPQTPQEQLLAAIWTEVLGVDGIGSADSFFDLGGHSLKATQVINRFAALTGIRLELAELFDTPTIAALARIADLRVAQALPPIVRAPPAADYPLTHAQRRVWILCQRAEAAGAYNLAAAYRIAGPLDADALARALRALVERHEILRTVFCTRDGEPRQRILPEPSADLLRIVEAVPEPLAYFEARARRDFDLERGPLFTAELMRTAPDEHLLLLRGHHIVADGWSVERMLQELAARYRPGAEHADAGPPPLSIHYRDYAVWQQALLHSGALAEARDYWRARFAGELPALDLPLDQNRPPRQTFAGRRLAFAFDCPLTALARVGGGTPFMVLTALVAAVLYRWTGQDDLVIGTPVAGRPRVELEEQLGFYANTLALRLRIDGEQPFAALLAQVREATLDAYRHQLYPFDLLVEDVAPARDRSRSPLFDVMVVLAPDGGETLRLPGLSCRPEPLASVQSRFDLTLFFCATPTGVAGRIEYNTRLFEEARIRRLLGHLETLLRGAVAQPATPLAHLPLLTPAERQRILIDFNRTAAPLPGERTVLDGFAAAARRTPQQVALACAGRTLSYRALDAHTDRLARRLRADHGIGADDRVAIMIERSDAMIVAILGVLKAGGAYLPIAADYPAQRRAEILADADCRLVLTGPLLEGLLQAPESPPATAVGEPLPRPRGDQLAYVIYTSGSTGRPKGCQIEHRQLMSYLQWALDFYFDGRVAGDFGLFTPLAFDFTVTCIFLSLLRSRTLYIYPETLGIDAILRDNFSPATPIDIVKLTPAHLSMLAHLDIRETNVRRAIIGGEALTPEQVNILKDLDPAIDIVNEYGPTETTVGCIVTHVERGEPVLIGRPIANTRCYLLDRALNPVPIGVPGEICIGGAGVGRGYLNREVLTRERFIQSPFDPTDRLYRTGDLGRWRADGEVEYLGRLDHQVKLRGYRIECGEIEQALLGHPAVREAVVLLREDGGERALAGYVRTTAAAPTPTDLRAYLQQRLPDYMIPAHLVVLERLPLTPNGKIDRRALPTPSGDDAPGRPYAPPRDARERQLAAIWETVLGRAPIGLDDDFFALGGDSIKAVQTLAALHRAGLKCDLRAVFQAPTLAALAPLLVPIDAVDRPPTVGPVPLTPIQRWFFETCDGNPAHYNHAVLLRARHRLDPARLERVLDDLLACHDMLRATYHRDGGQPPQDVQARAAVTIEMIDLSAEPHPTEALERHAAGLQSGFDLAVPPLCRAVLYRLSDADRLLLIVHHLIVDGVSWRILLADLGEGYRRAMSGQPAAPAARTDAYRDWADALLARAAAGPTADESAYWQAVEQAPATALPLDDPAGSRRRGDSRTIELTLPEDLTAELLTGVHRAYNTRINDVLLTALAQALGRWTGGRCHRIDLESHGRDAGGFDLSRTLGWFTVIYPLLLDLSGLDKPGDGLRHIKEQLRRVPDNGLGYGILRYLPGPGAPLPSPGQRAEILFNYFGQIDTELPGGLLVVERTTMPDTVDPHASLSHELLIGVRVIGGRLHLAATFAPRRLSPAAIAGLLADYRTALAALATHCTGCADPEPTPSDLAHGGLGPDAIEDLLDELDW